MSADGYSICPRCIQRARAEYGAVLETIDNSSKAGVSEAILKAARAGVKQPNPEDHREFREEYELYVTPQGVVQVSYSGSCTVCDLSVDFECEHPIPGWSA